MLRQLSRLRRLQKVNYIHSAQVSSRKLLSFHSSNRNSLVTPLSVPAAKISSFRFFSTNHDETDDDAGANNAEIVEESCADPINMKLLQDLTPELSEQLSGSSLAKKFKLKAVKECLEKLYKFGFPLPESLSFEDWNRLMVLNTFSFRVQFLDSLVQGKDTWAELQLKNETYSKPLQVPQDLLETQDVEIKEKLNRIESVFENLRQVWDELPAELTDEEWAELLRTKNVNDCTRAIRYIQKKRWQKLKHLMEKRRAAVIGLAVREEKRRQREEEPHIVYGLGNNCIMNRINSDRIDAEARGRCIRQFHEWGQPLVIDLSFVETMSFQEVKSLFYRELPFGFDVIQQMKEPFATYITGYNPDCPKCQVLKKVYPNLLDPEFPAVVTEKSFLDIFPRERLLYLSPDSRTDLIDYDPEDIYIVGGIVDIVKQSSLTLSAAKEMGIRHARLPMKRTHGIMATLNVDHVIGVLADFVQTKDWFYSMRWIPSRFFKNRLRNTMYTAEMEQLFLTHHALRPDGENVNLSAKEYRERYAAMMRQTDTSPNFKPDPEKYKNNSKASFKKQFMDSQLRLQS